MENQQQASDVSKSYFELSAHGYALAVEAVTSANRSALDYMKSVYEIVSRPYTATAPEAIARESVERSQQVAHLGIDALQQSAKHTSELLEKTATYASTVQETVASGSRGLAKTYASNLNYVRDTASAQVDEFNARTEKLRSAAVHSN